VKPSRLLGAPALLVALALGASGCAGVRAAALTVDGHRVSQSSVDRELRAIADNKALRVPKGDGTLSSDITARWMTVLVQQQVVNREVERRHIKVTDADRRVARSDVESLFGGAPVLDAFPKWFRDRVLERATRRAALLRSLLRPPTDADVRNEYERQVGDVNSQCQSRRFVARIVVKTRDEADAVAAQLAAGADFATLARQRSIDKGSAELGGELGCLDTARLDPPVAQVVQALPNGTVSAPIETQSGWNLLVVRDTIPFESVKDALRSALERDTAKAQPELGRLVAKAEVDLNPRYGRWVVKHGQGRVSPPAGATPPTTTPPSP
jgi:hypothetical protein